jgi:two-component system sensor histidine kinase KdpD
MSIKEISVRTPHWLHRSQAIALAAVTVLVATLVAFGAHIVLPLANLSLVFLTAVLITAGRAGMEAAIYASLLGFFSYNFFFTQPAYSLEVHDNGEVATLLFFLLFAILTGKLAARMQGQMHYNQQMLQRLTNINHFTRAMASAADRDGVLQALAHHLTHTFHATSRVVLEEGEGRSRDITLDRHGEPSLPPASGDRTVSEEEENGCHNGRCSFPLHTAHASRGMVFIYTPALQQDDLELARMLCDLAGLTLERALLVADLEQARVISESEQLRSALLSSVSHDLRTPLASIIGSTSSLIEYPNTINEQGRRELLQMVLEEAQRLNRYIQNLLDMTRLGGGKLTPVRNWVDLNDIISSALERLSKELAALRVEIVLPEDPPLLYVQGVLIEQALVNVLDNAARFSPPQGLITLTVTHDAHTLSITVCDQGPGIPPEQRERVFDMFYTVRGGDRNRQGTGLGLAICRGMISAHGGEVSALPAKPPHGACIRLTLPLNQSEHHDDSEHNRLDSAD